MKIYKSFSLTSPNLVVGIGNFDGVHRGHRRIIRCIRESAGPRGTPAVITFTPHTRREEGPRGIQSLTTLAQRLELLQKEGIVAAWICNFNPQFSRQTARGFVREILNARLRIEGLCVGTNFRFGRNRRGNVELLKKMGKELGFWVKEVPTVKVGGREVSSSIIRGLVREGKVKEASRLLGRDYCLSGKVLKGNSRGSAWGYPTANFYPEQLLPASGVYAARIQLKEGVYPGMLYLGRRPTFSPGAAGPVIAEGHLLGWKGSLYRRRIKVFLKKRLRGDIKFNDGFALRKQIQLDEKRSRRCLRL